MFAVEVGRGSGKDVSAGCGIGKGIRRERVNYIRRLWGHRYMRSSHRARGLRKRLRGEETNCLGHGRLEESSVRGVSSSMCRKDLSESKEGRKESEVV